MRTPMADTTLEDVLTDLRAYSRENGASFSAMECAQIADLLEAQEKAVPVGEVVGVAGSYGEMRMIRWRDRYSPAVGTKLYTHPAPADSERLAEALRAVLEAMYTAGDRDDDGGRPKDVAEQIEHAERIALEAIAAHSAQAQPNITDLTDDEWEILFHLLYRRSVHRQHSAQENK